MEIPQSYIKKNVSLWPFMLLGIVLGVTIFVVALWFRIEPIYTWTLGIGTAIATGIGNLKLPDFTNITTYITATPERMIGVLTACVTVPTAIYSLISKVRADKARAQAEVQKAQTELEASRYIQGVDNQNEALKKKVTDLETQVKNNTYSEQLQESQKIVTQVQEENKKLAAQVQALNEIILLKDTKTVEKVVVK